MYSTFLYFLKQDNYFENSLALSLTKSINIIIYNSQDSYNRK